MDIPKFTSPVPALPNLSLTDSIKNVASQPGGASIPSISAPNLSGATSALGGLGGGMGGAIGSAKDGMEKLTGPARAKFMASIPEIPEQAKGLKGVMEKGVDLGKFQENSVGNLMDKVSSFTPGKSMLSLPKELSAASGLKDKMNALKPSGALGGALGGAGIGAVAGAALGGGKNVLANAAKGAGIGAIAGGLAGAASNAAGGITGKIGSALGGGSIGNTIASGIAGAAGGAALAKLTGQSVNLKGALGNLAGSAAGGIGANIGSSLVGSNIPGMTGVGAAAGGAISGMIGGSAGKKALTGLAAGVGISAVTGLLTNKVNNAYGLNSNNQSPSAPSSGEASASQPQAEAQPVQSEAVASEPMAAPTDKIPDISKNTGKEVEELADKSPQSVQAATPPEPPPSTTTNPPVAKEIEYLKTNVPTVSIDNIKEVIEKRKTSKTESQTIDFVDTAGIPFMAMRGIFKAKYESMFGSNDFEVIRARLANDIKKVTPEDRARVKSLINSYPKNFSLAYMKYSSDDKSRPENRTLGFSDYIAMDTEDFYKFLTNVAEGDFELKNADSKKPNYKIFVNQKSPSEVTLTISHPAYGTATSVIARAIPPPMNELFDIKGMKECIAAYNLGKKIESDQPSGLWNALDPYDGSLIRMYAFNVPAQGQQNAFCCANNIIVTTSKAAVATGDSKGGFTDLKGTPPESAGPFGGWVAILKIENDKYFRVQYNAYTMEIFIVDVFKMVPKT